MEDNRRPVEQKRVEELIDTPKRRNVLDTIPVAYIIKGQTEPSVENCEHWLAHNTAPLTITYFAKGGNGQHLYILGDGQTTVAHNLLKIITGSGINTLLVNNKLYHFVNFNGVWVEHCCATGGGGGEGGVPALHAVSHQNGGTDEINVAGLSGLLADGQTPNAHLHNQSDITTLVADLLAKADLVAGKVPVAQLGSGAPGVGTFLRGDGSWQGVTPAAHATSHQNGGSDQINVTGLLGLLGDPQAPIAHFHDYNTDIGSLPDLSNLPSDDQFAALFGTQGTPSTSNRYVTHQDVRLSDARNPLAHATSHQNGGSDELDLTGMSGLLVTPQNPIIGSGATQAVAGNDPRLTDARAPTGHIHNYNVDIVNLPDLSNLPTADQADALFGTQGTPSTSNRYVTHQDVRNSDARTPLGHNVSHQSGGTDAIKLDDLDTPDDNTDLDASTTRHGLLKKLGGGTSNFLRADGTWASPATGGAHAASHQDGGSDEINVTGLLGLLGDPQTPVAHTHDYNTEIDNLPDLSNIPNDDTTNALFGTQGTPDTSNRFVTHQDTRNSDARNPLSHAASHANGAADEINVAGLSGVLADAQIPSAHGHDASDIISGMINPLQVPGAPLARKFSAAAQTISTAAAVVTGTTVALAGSKKYYYRFMAFYRNGVSAAVHSARVTYSGTLSSAAAMESAFRVRGTSGVPSVWAATFKQTHALVNAAMVTSTGGFGAIGGTTARAMFEVEGVIYTNAAGNIAIECISGSANGLVLEAGWLFEVYELTLI
jgi:hypothetical protein